MKQVVQVRLEADTAQLDVLARTLISCNQTANLVSEIAHSQKVFRGRDLRAISYAQARQQQRLGAQVAQSCIRKVADAYATLKANLRNGRYGKPGSARRATVEAKPIRFRSLAAQPFDDRGLSNQQGPLHFGENDLVAILTHTLGRGHAEPVRATEDHSLQPGTSAWSQFGIGTTVIPSESENRIPCLPHCESLLPPATP